MSTYPLRVVERCQETEDTASLFFSIPTDLASVFDYRVGQFVTIEEEIDGETIRRQYSLSTVANLDPRPRITVNRVLGGRMSTWLVDEVEVGDLLEVAPPRGRLYVPSDVPRHYNLLAAGSGIAPLVAIARHALAAGVGHRVTLAYGNRTPESIIFKGEVDRLTEVGATVEHVLSRPGPSWTGATGHVDSQYLASRREDWRHPGLPVAAFLCGPEKFMTAAEEFLLGRGVGIDDIRSESFDLVLNDDDRDDLIVPNAEEPVATEEGARLVAMVGGEEVEVVPEPGESRLAALLRVDADVPFSCQEGTRSSCIVKLCEGRVRIRPGVLKTLRPSDLEDGLILACLSRPLSAAVRIDFDEL